MKRRFFYVSFLAAALFVCTFTNGAGAVTLGDGWFDLVPSGPVSIKVNTPTAITVSITNDNNTTASHIATSLMIIVIDPFSGARVVGPVTKTLNINLAPGQKVTTSVSITIPSAPINYANKTLAAVISVMNGTTVRGTTGWGFVTVP